MTKKTFLLLIAFQMLCMTSIVAKINYVPLYIVDTHADVKTTRHAPAISTLIITQDNHKLLLPQLEESLMFKLLKGEDCVYEETYQPLVSTVVLPDTLAGDYEVRLCADSYYYHGLITLENGVPPETAHWENIMLLGTDEFKQTILNNLMGLNVVEYSQKIPYDRIKYMSEEDQKAFIKDWEENHSNRIIGLLPEEVREVYPQLVVNIREDELGIDITGLIPILICCIQELKCQLDARTEAIVDAVMSRSTDPLAVKKVRAAIGNTLLSVAPSSVNEATRVRYILTDDVPNGYLAVSDMGGRTMMKIPVSPSDTEALIDSGTLGEGIFLCTLFVNGEKVGTTRLIKTR